MDGTIQVAPGVFRLTVNLDDTDVDRFEGIWPVREGVALHAYLLQGGQPVLIDPWDAGGYGIEELSADLEACGLTWSGLRAVAFTKEPRRELVAELKKRFPGLEFWGLPRDQAFDLGAGRRLVARAGFWLAEPSGVMFSGDVAAGLGWVEDELWTEDLGEHEARYFEDEALRWFSSRPQVPQAWPETTRIVAPAHGCLWKDPARALARLQRFEEWGTGGLDEVAVVWPPDAEGADALVGGGLDTGVGLNLFRWPGDDVTAIAAGCRRSVLVVVADGLETPFLAGLEKEVWRPAISTPGADLRSGLATRFAAL